MGMFSQLLGGAGASLASPSAQQLQPLASPPSLGQRLNGFGAAMQNMTRAQPDAPAPSIDFSLLESAMRAAQQQRQKMMAAAAANTPQFQQGFPGGLAPIGGIPGFTGLGR